MTESQTESNPLNPSESQTKSKRGGKRPGAGRPRDPDSIRSQLETAVESQNKKDSFSRWQIERAIYISRHACKLVLCLEFFRDPEERNPKKTFLGTWQAYKIAHEKVEKQLRILKRDYRHILQRVVDTYAEYDIDPDTLVDKIGETMADSQSFASARARSYMFRKCRELLAECS